MRNLFSVLLCVAVVMLSGCLVVHSIKGRPGTDITPIKPGTTQAEAEVILGSAVREWQTPTGVRYRVYNYDRGVPTRGSLALRNALGDLLTFGVLELWHSTFETREWIEVHQSGRHQEGQVTISFDSNDVILGVFPDIGDFEDLPADGLAPSHTLKQ